jgi:hypothetical protein
VGVVHIGGSAFGVREGRQGVPRPGSRIPRALEENCIELCSRPNVIWAHLLQASAGKSRFSGIAIGHLPAGRELALAG